MEKYKCKRCGHGPWYPRTPQIPKMCPKCKSYKWNEPKKVTK